MMVAIMDGIRVLEVASWTYVPVAGAVLAEWGADVIKVENPEGGDPQRGLVTAGLVPAGGVAHMFELPNRGKRSVAINLASPEGRAVLLQLAARCDVFLTNYLPAARKKLGIDVEDIRAVNPDIIYVRGSANGQRGPESGRGGYDQCTFWGRTGAADGSMTEELGTPTGQPGAAYGDVLGGLTIAGGISAALLHRERTGEALVVDNSLIAMGVWAMGANLAGAAAYGLDRIPRMPPAKAPNPLVNTYRTADDRHLSLVMLDSDRFWPELVTVLGAPELADDERFGSHGARAANNEQCVATLADLFAKHTLAEWRELMAETRGVWAAVQRPGEVLVDPQVVANDYIADLEDHDGVPFKLVTSPLQFDEQPGTARRAPMHGEHTDDVITDLGYSMDELLDLKIKGAIL
jgi:crotonobetainyl-CoA:carnitine CoA-transferase CaiB-like acyl-CoA transferase